MSDCEALVTGGILALLIQYSMDPNRGIAIDKVHEVRDPDGNYRPFVDIEMRNGAKLRIAVIELDDVEF